MSANQDKPGGMSGFSLGRLNQFGATLRQSAQEIGAKAAAQVTEINTKLVIPQQAQNDAGSSRIDEEAEDGEKIASSPSASTAPTGAVAPLKTENVEKKQLLEMMQKMNQKLKLLTNIKQQLTERVEKVEKEKSQLRSLIMDEILNGGVSIEDGQDEYMQLQSAWRRVDEQNSMSLQQLQNEFKKLHTEQQQMQQKISENGNGNDPASSAWENEKQLLIQKHEDELCRIKEDLNKKVEELNAVTSSNASSNHSNSTQEEEVRKVKEAAAAQIQAFKQKVATARTAELTKVKAEMKEQAQDMLEKKSLEIKQQYELEVEELRKALADKSGAESNNNEQILALQQQYASDLQKVRSEADAAKTQEIERLREELRQESVSQMEAKVESVIAELKTMHSEEIATIRKESDEKLAQASGNSDAQVQSISSQAHAQIAGIQSELDQAKQTHEAAIRSLQVELESTRNAAKTELEQVKAASLSDASSTKDAEISKLREELNSSMATERENMLKQFAEEKENLRVDFQKRYQSAIQKIQGDANVLKDDAVKKVREEMAARFEEAKQQIEAQKADEAMKAISEAEASKNDALKQSEALAASEREKLKEELNGHITNLQQQLQQRISEVEKQSNQQQSLNAELEEVKSVLESVRSGEENSSMAMDEALSKQRAAYEDRIKLDESKFEQNLQALKQELEEAISSRDKAISETTSLRDSMNQSTEQNDSKKRVLEESVSSLQKELAERDENLANLKTQSHQQIASMTSELESLQTNLSQKEETLGELTTTLSQHTSDLAKLQKQLDESENQKADELSKIKEAHETALTLVSNQLKDKEAQLLNLSSTGNDANAALSTLQLQFNDLQSEYDAEVEKLRNDLETSTLLLNETKEAHEKQMSELRASLLSNASATESELANSKQVLIDEKNAEIASIKASYEAKLQESAKKEVAVAQTFNKVKSAYAQKMKTIETELSDKIALLDKEKSELQTNLEQAKENYESTVQKHKEEIEELRASVEQKTEELSKEKEEAASDLIKKLKIAEEAAKEHETSITKLEEELKVSREEVENARANTGESFQSQFNEKMDIIEKSHTKAMQDAQAEHEELLGKLREENELLKAKADFSEVLEKQKEELTSKLEAQARKSEEDSAKLRKAMEIHVDKMTAQFKEKLEAARKKAEADVTAMQNLNKEKEQKLTTLIERLKALTATSTKLRDENEGLKKKIETEAQNQNDLRSKLESLKKQYDESQANSSATASSLLQEQDKLQSEKAQLSNQMKSLQTALQSKNNKLEELSGKLSALTSNLNALTEERKEQDEKLERALRLESKLKASETEATDLRDQINKLKLERQKNITLVERLQAEKETNERNHSQRTALVGMLETQLSQLNDKNAEINAKFEAALYDLSQKEELVQSNEERLRKLEIDLTEAQSASKKASESLVAAQKNADSKSTKMVESLQKELQATKQQMVRKSTAAQRLIQQREAECAELRATNRALQQEVDKGSYSERRIFELAAKQSNRETLQISEIEARDSIIERLKQALLERDGDLANAEKHAKEVEGQIEELFRIRRREDVNIDYLKSIVVKYLSLPPGSDERARLLPVLATLLQFDDYDYKTIEEGKQKVSWWGSSVIPTLINAPTGPSLPAPSGSAEVSVSQSLPTQGSGDNGKQARTTSLQF